MFYQIISQLKRIASKHIQAHSIMEKQNAKHIHVMHEQVEY